MAKDGIFFPLSHLTNPALWSIFITSSPAGSALMASIIYYVNPLLSTDTCYNMLG
jgi:EamA domain-containing membrane protein RarD